MDKINWNRVALGVIGAGIIATVAIPAVTPWASYVIPAGVGVAMSSMPSEAAAPLVNLIKSVVAGLSKSTKPPA